MTIGRLIRAARIFLEMTMKKTMGGKGGSKGGHSGKSGGGKSGKSGKKC